MEGRQYWRTINTDNISLRLLRNTLNILLREPYKKEKRKHTQNSTHITTQTNEKREELSRYWNEISAAEDDTYIFQQFLRNVAKLIHFAAHLGNGEK